MALYVRHFARAPLTLTILMMWLALEAVRVPFFGDSPVYYQVLGLSRHGMATLFLWEPFTYALIHSGWFHTLMNALILLSVGSRLEWILGSRQTGLLILGGTLLGGGFHLMLSGNTLVGGSGAVFALLIAMTSLAPESRWLVPFPVSAKNLGRGLFSASLMLTLMNPALSIPGISNVGVLLEQIGMGGIFRISHTCHLGGALAGWLGVWWLLRDGVSLVQLQSQRKRRENQSWLL